MSEQLRYLSSRDVAGLLPPMKEVVALVEETLRQHGNGQTQLPPKTDLSPGGDAFLHAMPAFVGPTRALGLKWIAGFPKNAARQLPSIHGTLLLNDPDTGRALAILDAAAITAARTGACTAVTAKHLADPASEVLTIIGCGVQGRANLEALLTVLPNVERMLAFDVDVERQARFADEVMTTFHLASIIPPEPREACEGGHVIVTSAPLSKHSKPVIEFGWIQTGTLCVSLDFDASFTKSVFERADLFVTDDREQFRHSRERGSFAGLPDPTGDLGGIVTGKGPARPAGRPIVLACNLGLGILDVALGAEVLRRAEQKNVGTLLPR